ncbi:MAG TPA: bifunctional phosphoribosylaminoimidazolecarboxamide formyltransferase/IMP cyclohydrolase [Acidimicrobiia bacterium]|nr:bifunctional phosphoribosylaminoimidazolecarboxamide formyltransferase/IMP cyclohydrolase [Acidimicrobiia bacterium]
MTRRALLSVYDRTGLAEFASGLRDVGFELVASGGTAVALSDAQLPVTTVESLTGAPEMLGGRVKTLHPRVHGGLLADLGNPDHVADLERLGVEPFQLVVSNLYPFVDQPSIEMIDIGGPAMVRAAAKNHAWVGVVTSPDQYDEVLAELRAGDGALSDETRARLAREAFARTAAYDAAVVAWLEDDALLPEHLVLPLERTADALRYGENPHQRAARYRLVGTTSWWDNVRQHSGVALSYLNFYDTDAAWRLVHDLGDGPTCAIIKHANPCGVAVADTLAEAYARALACDEQSAFGGVVAMNRPIDTATVEEMVAGPQADVVIAPAYEEGTADALIAKRRNTRLLEAPPPEPSTRDVRQLSGGFLVQEPHRFVATRDDWRVVTKVAPTDAQWRDAELAWRLCGHVKSNAIVLVKDGQAVGIGAGQQKRVDSGEIAARKAAGRAQGGACASDAFYPFPDGLEAAAAAGAIVVVQPGGAMRDEELTRRADELGLAMVLTGERHFLH